VITIAYFSFFVGSTHKTQPSLLKQTLLHVNG
jgi:hypothetical protein